MNTTTWIISFFAVAGVIVRPFKINEAYWAVAGALAMLLFGLLTPREELTGISKGTDVYLFLIGMMLLAETAREEKLFDWLAAHATQLARGSGPRLFLLIYLVGIVVTTFLSNDATAVVLTPAVAAAVKTAKATKPLPYLFICAFIANAASFVLPISNPANLVIYGSRLPELTQWLHQYLVPSVVAIVVTYIGLRFTLRKQLTGSIETCIPLPSLSKGGQIALLGIIVTAVILLTASGFGVQLGLPTAITGMVIAAIVSSSVKKSPVNIIKGISWSVLPLVAGLFVIVEGLNKTGMTQLLTHLLQHHTAVSVTRSAWSSGVILAYGCNLVNNLPAGLIAGNVIQAAHSPEIVKSAVLIGVDLGPNLSVTGSLATILWLGALRREGITVNSRDFLKLGCVIMSSALIAVMVLLAI